MFDVEFFSSPVLDGIVNDPKAEGGKRDARWIPAVNIPTYILHNMFGYGLENKRHPHNIPGMAWDLTANGWRNMKNAQIIGEEEMEITWDMTDSRTFIG
jgi:hypothetical protein